MISTKLDTFQGRTVMDYKPGTVPVNSAGTVYRLESDYDNGPAMSALIPEFLSHIPAPDLQALVIGSWVEPYETSASEFLTVLVDRAAELGGLRALFVGDMTYEECEISWIVQGDYTPLLNALGALEVLRIRGSNSLVIAPFTHHGLRQFIIECGGLGNEILKNLAQSAMPALEHLELWLGADDYGFNSNLATVQRAVTHLCTPALRYLGLRNAQIADEVAVWLAGEPWVAELDTLDLSLGVISDKGAQALLASPHVARLKRLDLSHHYISAEVQAALRRLPVEVVLDDPQDANEDEDSRYVSVGE